MRLAVEDFFIDGLVNTITRHELKHPFGPARGDPRPLDPVGDNLMVSGANRVRHRYDWRPTCVIGEIATSDHGVDGRKVWDLREILH